jgi:hypothetical protein
MIRDSCSISQIERSGQVVTTPTSYSEVSRVQISAWRPAILTEGFRGFPQSHQANAGIVP